MKCAIVVQMGTGAVVARADGTNILRRVVRVAVEKSPPCGRGDVGKGILSGIL